MDKKGIWQRWGHGNSRPGRVSVGGPPLQDSREVVRLVK